MKKKGILFLICCMTFLLMACGARNDEQSSGDTENVTAESTGDMPDYTISEESPDMAETEEISENTELPAYEYPGPELFYSVLYQYLIDELGKNYDEAEVTIPSPVIVEQDESDPEDIRVWGDFWIMNYNLDGDILECVSGGSYPGVIHIKSDYDGYTVTGMEIVEDGSDFTESAERIFGEHYDEFMKIYSDSEYKEEIRAQIIANYVAANDLNITAYQDYGQDPVELPGENIDSFYSVLD